MSPKKDRARHDWYAPMSRRVQAIWIGIALVVIVAALLYLLVSGGSFV
ncbi:MAG: hypothetical protein QM635_09160 [Microbacteriaceae bacterium]